MKLYLLNYDTDTGSREEWNIFYTPTEAFSTDELRKARIEVLKKELDEDDEPMGYEFHKFELETDSA